MLGVLALDIGGSRTGWAFSSAALGRTISGSRGFVHGPDVGPLFAAFADWLADKITDFNPHALVIEAPISGRHAGGRAAYILDGLSAISELIAYRRDLAFCMVHTATVRKHFCGSGRAKKPDVLAECVRRGWNPGGHDEADALALLAYMTRSQEQQVAA